MELPASYGTVLTFGPAFGDQFHQIKLYQPYKSSANKAQPKMSAKKKLSNGSLPTQTESSRRFVRRNSFHTLNCRSGSLKKMLGYEELMASTPQLQPSFDPPLTPNPQRPLLEIETEDLFKQFAQPYEIPFKRSAGSMKVDSCRGRKCEAEKAEALGKQLERARHEGELLAAQCKKLKAHLQEERQLRQALEEEAQCSQLQIKRLEKRIQKYRNEKDRYEQERTTIIAHIEELEALKFDEGMRTVQGYCVKVMQEQVSRLRLQLQKTRGMREHELLAEMQRLTELKYAIEAELKSANIANVVLTRQLQEAQQEMSQLRDSMHKAVTSSYEYIQLRERYRKSLIQYRQLQIEMSMMERDGSSLHTLTISQSSDNEI